MRVLLIAACLASPVAAGQVQFEDLSDRLPSHQYTGGWEHFVGGGVAVFDCNGDARPDIFLSGGEGQSHLAINRGDFTFESGSLPPLDAVTGAYPLDIDGDGWLDLFVLRVGPNTVLKGGPDCHFTDATSAFGVPPAQSWSTAFTAWWEDGATRPTMVVGNYVDRDDPEGPFGTCDANAILSPAPAGGYRATPLEPGFCALSVLAARDATGTFRLRISNDRHYYVRGGHEQMYDIESARFLGEADGWPTVSLWGMGIASQDLTGDGRDEVMLTSMGDQLLQLAGADGIYRAAPYAIGTYAQRPFQGDDGRPSTGWHAEFADVNNDGRVDLFIAKGNVDQMPGNAMEDPNNLLLQQSDGTFVESAGAAGVASPHRSRGAALADFDGDGRVDLVVVNRRARAELYRNVSDGTGAWLGLDIRQAGANGRLIGGRVEVITDAGLQSRQITVGGGHGGGSAVPLSFGLGAAGRATVRVFGPRDRLLYERRLEAGRVHRLFLD